MKQRDLIIILVPAFILTVLWVIFNVYHNYVTSTITDPLTYQIIPINGTFDTKAVAEIKQRKRVEPANEITINGESATAELSGNEATESSILNTPEPSEEEQ